MKVLETVLLVMGTVVGLCAIAALFVGIWTVDSRIEDSWVATAAVLTFLSLLLFVGALATDSVRRVEK